jgi:hypothetical protein
MAKQEVYWFKHDGNAHRDIKIIEMMGVYGAEGYGWFWILLELMREATDYKLKYAGKYGIKTLAQEMRAEPERLKEFIDDCINEFELFQADDKYFWSPSFLRRMSAYNQVIETKKQAALSRWSKQQMHP